ncbi:ABC transporter ATP-binding protein [Pseudorhodoplanes sp.]|jgi:branched-chain amino acid transport system ATP-binding protein|uniref:ABC transporter ATP-binding protein n=1 Tax=Pseudorhodoplanes sp. TaxID=1934341 RepID=UPI003D11077C
MNDTVLELIGVRAGYHDAVIVDDINLRVAEGEVVCLLGSNGAGKTTIMRTITGLIPVMSGAISYQGSDITTRPAHDRVTAGICLSPEGRQVFPELTVEENLIMGAYNKRARANRQKTLQRVFEIFPRLSERTKQAAGSMSGGEQQMLAIGRALMGEPKLLALDEPSLGLAPKMVLTLFEAIRTIAKSGITILLVEQNTRAALTVAQRGYVLSAGRIVYEATTSDLAESEMVQKAFIGSSYGRHRGASSRRERRLAATAGGERRA